jgi:hypothetical protein
MRALPFSFLLLTLLAAAANAAPPRPRPFSGCGVLTVASEPATGRTPVVLYREPGVERLLETDAAALPRLSAKESEPLLAVTRRKGRWTRVAYDDGGREGWLEQGRRWRFLSWEEFLPGRLVSPLPGLKKGWYAVRSEPRDSSAEQAQAGRDHRLRVLQVADDWVRLERPAGWFRWRDPDGRLTISPGAGDGGENR